MPARELRLGALLLLARRRGGGERTAIRLPENSRREGALRRKGRVQDLALRRHPKDGCRGPTAQALPKSETSRLRGERGGRRKRRERRRDCLPFGRKNAIS